MWERMIQKYKQKLSPNSVPRTPVGRNLNRTPLTLGWTDMAEKEKADGEDIPSSCHLVYSSDSRSLLTISSSLLRKKPETDQQLLRLICSILPADVWMEWMLIQEETARNTHTNTHLDAAVCGGGCYPKLGFWYGKVGYLFSAQL